MYYIYNLKKLLEGRSFEKARIFRKESITDFTSVSEVIQNLKSHGPPGEGSSILLKEGSWISYTCHAAGYECYYCWELHERPSW